MIPAPSDPLIVALDVSDLKEADSAAAILAPHSGMLKVGLELFWAYGPYALSTVGAHGPVFADAKLHDIPNTVERASANIARQGVAMFNVHASGGPDMMRAAVEGARRGAAEGGHSVPLVIAVTVLSSQPEGHADSPVSLAEQARQAGLDGVVVSGSEVEAVRKACGEGFCLVVPGIRPSGSGADDQVRVLTPQAAIKAGADYIVVGRPITGASDMAEAAAAIAASVRR